MSNLAHIKKILVDARSLVMDESKWTQSADARDEKGQTVPFYSSKACCWCAAGAIYKAFNNMGDKVAFPEVEQKFRYTMYKCGISKLHGIVTWNDLPSTTHQDVINVFDRAIADCE